MGVFLINNACLNKRIEKVTVHLQKEVTLNFIELGKPVENAYIESFNGKVRDEFLNENWFVRKPED